MNYLMFHVFYVDPKNPLDYFFFFTMLLALFFGAFIVYGVVCLLRSMWRAAFQTKVKRHYPEASPIIVGTVPENMSPYYQGEAAYWVDDPVNNPYPQGTQDARDWAKGRSEAQMSDSRNAPADAIQ